MATNRLTLVTGEALTQGTPNLRVTKVVVEALVPNSVATVQLVGNFLDLNGNPLSNGYLTILLPDAVTSNGKQLTATSARVPLDNNGAIAGTLTVYPTDTFVGSYPTPALYRVSVHSADGAKAWKSS